MNLVDKMLGGPQTPFDYGLLGVASQIGNLQGNAAAGLLQGQEAFQQSQLNRSRMGQLQQEAAMQRAKLAQDAATQKERQNLARSLDKSNPLAAAAIRAGAQIPASLFAPKPPELKMQTIIDGTTERRVLMDMTTGQIVQEYGKGPRWNPNAKPLVQIGADPGFKVPSGYRANQNEEGAWELEAVPGGPAELPTEGERKAGGYYVQMKEANQKINDLEKEGTSSSNWWSYYAGKVPVFGASMTSEDAQLYKSAAVDWTLANLRRESGAAITRQEAEQYWTRFFPVPGEGPKIVEQKRAFRESAERSAKVQAGRSIKGYDKLGLSASTKGGKELTLEEQAELEGMRKQQEAK